MIVLDASVWISSIQADENHHEVSRRFRARWRVEGIQVHVPSHFLVEITATIARNTESEALGLDALQAVIDNPHITYAPLSSTLVESAARVAARCRIRAGAALYVALAQELEIPLITWDDELLDRARVLVDVQVPAA